MDQKIRATGESKVMTVLVVNFFFLFIAGTSHQWTSIYRTCLLPACGQARSKYVTWQFTVKFNIGA